MIKTPIKKSAHPSPELTPLIDIIFIVVVFLMLTANTPILSLPIDIPKTGSNLKPVTKSLKTITIYMQEHAPQWRLETGNSKDDFTQWLRFKNELVKHIQHLNSQGDSLAIHIATARDLEAEKLLQTLVLLNEKQISNIHIMLEENSL